MHQSLFKFIQLLPLYIFLTACSTHITVENNNIASKDQIPNHAAIRVVLSPSFSNISPFNNSNLAWQYKIRAKLLTEQQLEKLGFTVVDKGMAPDNNGNPTLIAIVDSTPVEEQYQVSRYTMVLLEPLTANNPILTCNARADSSNICIAPETIQNTKTLYQSDCLYQGAYNAPATVVNYCILSAFHNFPSSSHNKLVYKNDKVINSKTPTVQP